MIRELQASDIIAIKDNLVESRDIWPKLTKEMIDNMATLGPAYTYLKDGKVVACCGAIRQGNDWEVWALYSNSFPAWSFARIDAAQAFREKLMELWAEEKQKTGSRARFSIPSDLVNGDRYAKFMGGVLVASEPNKIFPGVTNAIYEVA